MDFPLLKLTWRKKNGFFVKNYMTRQIIIDRDNFHPDVSYNLAGKVFWKNFSWNSVALRIKDDLIQEAVTRMFELSGKVKERANEKYSANYGYFWVAHNAMLAYLKTWERQTKWCESFEDEADPIKDGKKFWSPDFGWVYC